MPPLLLLTVTKTETQAVLKAFAEATGQPWQRRHLGDKTYYALGSLGGADLFLVQSEMGLLGPGAALLTVHKAIGDLSPATILMVGMAFGVRPGKQHLGDILVSRQLQSYEPQKLKGGRLLPRGDRVTCSPALLDRFRSADLDWDGGETSDGSRSSVHFGLLLSGEKLIAEASFRDELLALEPEAIGGEMEGAGLYTAASDARVDWILVKAICDWADGDKDDAAQPLAAANAAAFVRHAIEVGGWEHFTPSNAAGQAGASYHATLTGDGAIAQGPGSRAVGKGGVYIGGNVGGDVVTGQIGEQAGPGGPSGRPSQALKMARRLLTTLEEQAAGYTSLTIPAHLKIELEDQRKEVAALERRLGREA